MHYSVIPANSLRQSYSTDFVGGSLIYRFQSNTLVFKLYMQLLFVGISDVNRIVIKGLELCQKLLCAHTRTLVNGFIEIMSIN